MTDVIATAAIMAVLIAASWGLSLMLHSDARNARRENLVARRNAEEAYRQAMLAANPHLEDKA